MSSLTHPIDPAIAFAHDLPFFGSVKAFLGSERAEGYVNGMLLFIVGFLLARLLSNAFMRTMEARLSKHQLLVWRRMMFYTVLTLFTISALREMGFKLSVLLGAAGVLSVAIGFASQTSASNLISGLFLIGEGPFSIGDYIQVGQIQGEVLSIDLMSVKLRTVDNLYVRIPNETLIKSELTNLTRFPIRRVSIPVCIAYKDDIATVKKLLLSIADEHALCLDEPKPQVYLQDFGASSVNLMFHLWVKQDNFLALKDSILEQMKTRFDQSGVEIPYQQIVLHQASGRRSE